MHSRRQFLASAAAALAAPAGLGAVEDLGLATLPAALAPALVALTPPLPAGQIHIVPDDFALYWTLPDGRAMRYFVGVGQDALYESGTFFVGAKKEWPSWTPTPAMIRRNPEHYGKYAGGMPGGPGNPLGARALYLFQEGRGDTFLRIHGTDKPDTILQDVSNGCARLVDAQVVDLYNRVPLDTPVTLYPKDIARPFLATPFEPPVTDSATVPEVTVEALDS